MTTAACVAVSVRAVDIDRGRHQGVEETALVTISTNPDSVSFRVFSLLFYCKGGVANKNRMHHVKSRIVWPCGDAMIYS